MPGIFTYEFMQRAFLVGILLAVIIPCIGSVIVFRRLSLIGDALSHTSLAGVAIGLLLGFNPIVGALAACLLAAFSIDFLRQKLPRFSELSIAIVLSVGVGLAAILSGFIKNATNFNSFLFGSIVAVSNFETILVAGTSLLVLLAFTFLYKELFYMIFDEQAAALGGVPVKIVNTIFTILTALTVSMAARTIGALIVSSIMVLPIATAMLFAKSYRKTLIWAIGFALLSTTCGLVIAFYAGLKPGGTIILTAVVCFLLTALFTRIHRIYQKKSMLRIEK